MLSLLFEMHYLSRENSGLREPFVGGCRCKAAEIGSRVVEMQAASQTGRRGMAVELGLVGASCVLAEAVV